ncbi:MAG: hypothetical protein FJ279_18525 [Planctomycetes bacterium]|nr:hypothetical protein [Planctomycetota bacterium]
MVYREWEMGMELIADIYGKMAIAVIAFVAFLLLLWVVMAISTERERRRRLGVFWSRSCLGRQWRTRFPDATKDEIRGFLDTFVDAFGYSKKKRLKFGPDDKVMDVYQAEYPSPPLADDMELEQLVMNVQERYGLDLCSVWKADMTLGQVFEVARKGNPNQGIMPR